MIVGMFVYLLQGVLDLWFVPSELANQVWIIRLLALCVPVLVISLSFTPVFAQWCHPLLASVGLAAGVGVISVQMILPVESAAYYYPLMVLVTFFTYNFIGTRFIFALCVDLILLVAYNLLFGWVMDYPPNILISHDFFIISANLIGGSAGYLAERQGRILFLREKELEEERQFHQTRSLHDGLTGLPNRDLLHDRLSQAMLTAQREGSTHCGFFLDLDGFKCINDKLSHKTGDLVLKEVARRLTSAVRGMDTVARIGGDEFFILALDIDSEAGAYRLAEKLLDQFKSPFLEIPEDMPLSASIGMCLLPYEGMNASDFIQRADKAMYQAKDAGKAQFVMTSIQKEAAA